jgi:FHA domain
VDKFIINHGERVTEHELGPSPLVIGRDPECDLFFADKKLSRRHARIERNGPSVRLIDLGSRNGSWVNEERIQERDLSPGDEIRLGGLHISFERAPEAEAELEAEADQSTVYLTGEPKLPESGTVVLSREELEAPAESSQTVVLAETPPVAMSPGADADDSATVFLTGGATRAVAGAQDPPLGVEDATASADEEAAAEEPVFDELDETLQKPEPERTVVLETQATPASRSNDRFDTGQVLFRGQVDPRLQYQEAKTRHAHSHGHGDDATRLEAGRESYVEHSHPSLTASVTFVPEIGFSRRSWSARFALLIGGLVLFSLFVLAFPLLRILSPAVAEESRLRARALVDLLAASSEEALGEARVQELSVERFTREPGVSAAFVLSPAGAILAPTNRAGETLSLEGLGTSVADVRNFRSGTSPAGEWLMAQPISYRGRRVGVAVLIQRPPSAAVGAATLALVVGGILLLMAGAVVVLLGRKMTLDPVDELRRDVDAFVDGGAMTIPVARPYGELSLLALSLNRLLGRRSESGTNGD